MKRSIITLSRICIRNYLIPGRLACFIGFLFSLSLQLSGQKLQSQLTESWTMQQWLNEKLTYYSYDANGNYTGYNSKPWETIGNRWLPANFRMICILNPEGIIDYWYSESFDKINGWKNLARDTFTYDSEMKVLSELSDNWVGDLWVQSHKISYYYSGNGSLFSQIYQDWTQENGWKNLNKKTTAYREDGKIITEIISLSEGNDIWTDSEKWTYEYNMSENLITKLREKIVNNIWEPVLLEKREYDENNNLSNLLTQLWDTETGTWLDFSKYVYNYNPDGTVLQEVYQECYSAGIWTNKLKQTYSYFQTTSSQKTSANCEIVIYPNPVVDKVIIKTGNTGSDRLFCLIYDFSGNLLENILLNSKEACIPVFNLSKGVYFLRIISGVKELKTEVLVKK